MGRPRRLGASGLTVSALGVGTNRWGARGTDQESLGSVMAAAVDAGVTFFDTAEIYMGGRSERLLGAAARTAAHPVVLASKFAPLPYRLTGTQFERALDRTLGRLGLDAVDLYYLHFPFSVVGVGSWMNAMARAVQARKIRAVGVSNCSVAQMRAAAGALARYDIPLAANQVQYSLTSRKPETNGVLEACREMDVALVAYRPIGGGAIGKGGGGGDRSGLAGVLDDIAGGRGATATQVALAWLLRRDDHVIPIPGATKPHHVTENAGALGLALTDDEFAAIDKASSA